MTTTAVGAGADGAGGVTGTGTGGERNDRTKHTMKMTTPNTTPHDASPRARRGFTLIELFIAMAAMVVMSALVYPKVVELDQTTRPVAMRSSVDNVRNRIEYHRHMRDVDLSSDGYPQEIDPHWFVGGRLPTDVWTRRPLDIQVVSGSKTATVPSSKSFNVKKDGTASGHTAWYNKSNGSFCVMVPKRGTDEEVEALFDAANGLAD